MEFLATDFVALFWLVAMEIVLGIDNIVFITILTARLPAEQQKLGRRVGLILALVSRILLLGTLFFFLGMNQPLFKWTDLGVPQSWFEVDANSESAHGGHGHEPLIKSLNKDSDESDTNRAENEESPDNEDVSPEDADSESASTIVIDEETNGVSIRDIILLVGGLFLLAKSVYEIHEQLNDDHSEIKQNLKTATFTSVVMQVAMIDIVFSLDSVITAVGMADNLGVMVAAIILAVIVMLIFSEVVAEFVEKHPTVKMLALSFLILIGVMLVAESVGAHLDKGYIYFAMAFALGVEFLNLKVRGKGGHKKEATK